MSEALFHFNFFFYMCFHDLKNWLKLMQLGNNENNNEREISLSLQIVMLSKSGKHLQWTFPFYNFR